MEIEFLQVEDVLYIHKNQIEAYGGDYGVRDDGLLDSAVAQPWEVVEHHDSVTAIDDIGLSIPAPSTTGDLGGDDAFDA